MPNIKAAEKWVRQTEKRTVRNLDVKTRLKTLYKKAVASQDAETLTSVASQFDKAARKKSRMAKAARAAAAAPAPKAKSSGTAKTTKKKAAK